MITSETKTFGIFAGVVCMLAVSALGGALYFIEKKAAAYDTELQTHVVRAATEKEAQSLTALVVETANDRDELTKYVLTENSVVGFLSRIGDLASAKGLTAETRSLAVEAIAGNAVFEQLTLEVDVTGSFESVTQLLPVLESLPYQVHVRTVTIERTSEAKGNMLWHGSYHLSVTKYK